jgi:hypothetical protein
MGVEQIVHARERRRITARFAAACVRSGGDLPGRAATSQQLLDKGLTHPKKGGNRALRTDMLVTSAQNFLSEVEGIGFHALNHKSSTPYIQSKTAINFMPFAQEP